MPKANRTGSGYRYWRVPDLARFCLRQTGPVGYRYWRVLDLGRFGVLPTGGSPTGGSPDWRVTDWRVRYHLQICLSQEMLPV